MTLDELHRKRMKRANKRKIERKAYKLSYLGSTKSREGYCNRKADKLKKQIRQGKKND